MKIGSYNIRGLGSRAKKDELQTFFTKYKLDLCCVQETKTELFSDFEGRAIWGSSTVKWYAESSRGRSGGLLTFWSEEKLH